MRWTILALVLLLVGPAAETTAGENPRNVLLIGIDTLRADHMSLYGYERPTTPRMEEFAATALTFGHALSPAGWTRPSVASFFTGLHPSVHACESHESILDASHHTLAERLQEKGFTTVGFYANYNVAAKLGFDQGFDRYFHPPPNAGYPGDKPMTDAAEINRHALRWLREERPDEPWLLFLFYVDPHDPYLPHDEHDFGRPGHGHRPVGSREMLETLKAQPPGRSLQTMRNQVRDLYDGEIAYVDRHVGEVLDTLESEGLADETVVILTADHGEGLWEHRDYRGHGELPYEHQIHVPLVVRWPGRTEAGTRVQRPVNAMDFFGALARAYDLGGDYQARSVFDYVADEDFAPAVLVEQAQPKVAYRTIHLGTEKLISWDLLGRFEAYDLATNPGERQPRGLLEDPARLEELKDRMRLRSARNDSLRATIDFTGGSAELGEEEKEGLRALGYVE